MDKELYNRLNEKDKLKVDSILEKAKKKPKKRTYSKRWLYDYMDESFKDFSYDNFHDVMDMLELLYEIGIWVKVKPKKDLIYIINEYMGFDCSSNYFCDATILEIRRWNRLLKKFNINKKDILKFYEEKNEI